MNTKIDDDIKSGQFENVYLLYGEERYLLNQKKELLLNALVGDSDLNFARFDSDTFSAGALIDFAETLPFLSDHRVALLEDTDFFKESAPEALLDYISEIPETTVLIFVEKRTDARSKMFKAVQKNGAAVEYKRETEAVLLQWISSIFKKEGKRITRETASELLERTGNDMVRIRSELDKLLAYCLEKDEVTKEDLDTCVHGISTDSIYDLLDAAAAKDLKKAFSVYTTLLSKKESPFRLLRRVTWQYEFLIRLRDLDLRGYGVPLIADHMSLSQRDQWKVRKNLPLARKYSMDDLKSALSACAEAEEAIKTGRMDEASAFELLLASQCSPT